MNETLKAEQKDFYDKINRIAKNLIDEIPSEGPLLRGVSKPEQFATLQQWKKMLSKVIDNLYVIDNKSVRKNIIDLNVRVINTLNYYDPKQGH